MEDPELELGKALAYFFDGFSKFLDEINLESHEISFDSMKWLLNCPQQILAACAKITKQKNKGGHKNANNPQLN